MIIGLDIDNVVSDFDGTVFKEFLLEDKNKRNAGVIKKSTKNFNHEIGDWTIEKFDWTKDEVEEFYANNMERIVKNLKLRRNCKKYMDKLLEDGHKLILISHRAYPHYKNPMETTLNWLKKNNVNYTKLIISNSPNKANECKKCNIEIMVDDRVEQCIKMRENGVNCVLMLTKFNKEYRGNLPYFKSWKQLYRGITKLSKKQF